jgi:phosphoglycerate dehydrogenase-like enzyme
MKPGATLINTSRGAVINEPELCEALAERPDLTAILDVTHPEPPEEDSPLFQLPNVILTPHIAGSMSGEVTRMGRWMVDEFLRYLAGKPLKHVVTRHMLERMA